MTSSQAKLVPSLSILAIAAALWLYSYFVSPGTGLVRTAVLFGFAWWLLARYDQPFRHVSQEHPFNRTIIGGIFAAWLFAILACVLLAQSAGYEIPTGRGINRPLGVLVLVLPLVGAIGWRFRQVYAYLGRSGA